MRMPNGLLALLERLLVRPRIEAASAEALRRLTADIAEQPT
jgi:hypothetical protein